MNRADQLKEGIEKGISKLGVEDTCFLNQIMTLVDHHVRKKEIEAESLPAERDRIINRLGERRNYCYAMADRNFPVSYEESREWYVRADEVQLAIEMIQRGGY